MFKKVFLAILVLILIAVGYYAIFNRVGGKNLYNRFMCNIGFSNNCLKIGNFYTFTKDSVNHELAKVYFKKGCDKNHIPSCNNLAFLNKETLIIGSSLQKALELYKKGCDHGNKISCANLAYIYKESYPNQEVSAEEILKYYKKACYLDDFASCNEAGKIYAASGLFKEALDVYTKACNANMSVSCNNLALLYQQGLISGKIDNKTALNLYKKACDLKNYSSCNNYAYTLMYSPDIEKNPKMAVDNFKLACEHGDLSACNNIAILLQDGNGVEKDVNQAAAIFKQTCDRNFAISCTNLGVLLLKQQDNESINLGVSYLKKSCELGDGNSCNILNSLSQQNP